MKAYEIVSGNGVDAIRCVDRPAPVAKPGQVLIEIRACALNFRDLINIRGPEDGRNKITGVIPLSDGAGVVTAVGEGGTE